MSTMEDEPVMEGVDAFDLRTPLRPDGLGLSQGLMEDFILRRAVVEGRVPMTTIADRLHISVNIVDALVQSMRERKLVEFDGLEGRAYVLSVTDAGRAYTSERSR